MSEESVKGDESSLFEVIGRDKVWSSISDGTLSGARVGKSRDGEAVVAMSLRHCPDPKRWTNMPSLEAYTSLNELDLHKCRYIRTLHGSVTSLAGLEVLILTRCERLTMLPEDVGRLENLREVSYMILNEETELY